MTSPALFKAKGFKAVRNIETVGGLTVAAVPFCALRWRFRFIHSYCGKPAQIKNKPTWSTCTSTVTHRKIQNFSTAKQCTHNNVQCISRKSYATSISLNRVHTHINIFISHRSLCGVVCFADSKLKIKNSEAPVLCSYAQTLGFHCFFCLCIKA